VPPVFENAEDVNHRMKRAGLSRIAPAVLKVLQPSIRLVVGEHSEEPITRLGGKPNMAADIAWPTRTSGDPHSFLAQIDLAALGICDGLPLPAHGSLFFFCDAEYLPDSRDPRDVSDGIKVVYSATSLTDNRLRTPPPGFKGELIFDSVSLKPALDLTAPAQDVWEIECLHLSDAELYAYGELFTQVCASDESVHRMGGYPNVVQHSRPESRSSSGAADWRLLLQLDSEKDAGMMWGDQGRLYFMIRDHDLRSLSFDKVGLDCQGG
jgi:uncharacterized protein YwqG